jgi:hypothetical protein
MNERFTYRSRKVMQLANQAAQRFRHEYIGTEHILLGLVNEGSGAAAKVLENLDIASNKIQSAIEWLVQSGPDMVTIGKLPQTPRAKKVIEYAIEEARKLNHGYVGTEHLLLGLLREEEGVAAQVLIKFGLKLEIVRNEVLTVLGQAREESSGIRSLEPQDKRPDTVEIELEAPPDLCPKCGAARVVRVLWRGLRNSGPDDRDIEAGKAILASISATGDLGPPWVCLQCRPGWTDVHRLAMHDYQLQLDKEEAIRNENFETAATRRDAQIPVRQQLSSILHKLLKNQ